jgi:malic enzyme
VIAVWAAEQVANDTSTQILIAALGAGSVGAIAAALITGMFSRRRLGSEAAEIITKAAAGVVTQLEGELTRNRAAMIRMEAEHTQEIAQREEEWATEREDIRRVLQLHVAWDAIAIAKMAEVGVELPPAPPLLPPLRAPKR